MSRTARAVVAGLVTAGVLAVGAGVAYADEPGNDDGSNGTGSVGADATENAPSTDEGDAGPEDGGGGLPGSEVLGGLAGGLPVGL